MARTQRRNFWQGLIVAALFACNAVSAQTTDADIDAVQRKLDAAKQAQAAKEAAERREAAAQARMATLVFRTDADCELSINGETQAVLATGQTKAVKVNPGEQLVDCVSTELSATSISQVRTATAGTQIVVLLELAAKVRGVREQQAAASRAQAEAEARAQREKALRERYVVQTDGNVRDQQTGLLWAGRDNGSDINWNAARAHCEAIGAGWSLPTVAELQGLVDESGTLSQQCGGGVTCRVTPSIGVTGWRAWSSEPKDSIEAWDVNLKNGSRLSFPVGYAGNGRALCVRRS